MKRAKEYIKTKTKGLKKHLPTRGEMKDGLKSSVVSKALFLGCLLVPGAHIPGLLQGVTATVSSSLYMRKNPSYKRVKQQLKAKLKKQPLPEASSNAHRKPHNLFSFGSSLFGIAYGIYFFSTNLACYLSSELFVRFASTESNVIYTWIVQSAG